ncbi:hypothetical protein [Ignatzschineria sp. LJL83]
MINRASSLMLLFGLLIAVVFLLLFSYLLSSSNSLALNAPSYLAPMIIGLLLLSIVLWSAQTYHYLRVNIDYGLFLHLLHKEENGEDIAPLLSQLDETLISMGMMKSLKAQRSLENRARGALKLLRQQIIILISQCFIISMMVIILMIWSILSFF